MTRTILLLALLLAPPALAQAPQADAGTQFAMGEAFRLGKGMKVDRDQAIAWYRKAAAQGHQGAKDALGIMLFTKGERKQAMPLLQSAAQRGDPRALYILGTAHFNGDAVPRDVPRAYAEMKRAAAAGLPEAQRNLAKMEAFVTPDDRAKAVAILAGRDVPVALPAPAPAPAPAAAPAATMDAPIGPRTGVTLVPTLRPAPAIALPPTIAPPPPAIRTAATPADQPVATPPATAASDAPPPILRSEAPATTTTLVPRTTPSRADLALHPPILSTPPRGTARPLVQSPRPAGPGITASPIGRWRVQLGAYRSAAQAENQWAVLAGRVPGIAKLPHVVAQAGEFWRLQANGLAAKPQADALCRRVADAGGACFTLAP